MKELFCAVLITGFLTVFLGLFIGTIALRDRIAVLENKTQFMPTYYCWTNKVTSVEIVTNHIDIIRKGDQ